MPTSSQTHCLLPLRILTYSSFVLCMHCTHLKLCIDMIFIHLSSIIFSTLWILMFSFFIFRFLNVISSKLFSSCHLLTAAGTLCVLISRTEKKSTSMLHFIHCLYLEKLPEGLIGHYCLRRRMLLINTGFNLCIINSISAPDIKRQHNVLCDKVCPCKVS